MSERVLFVGSLTGSLPLFVALAAALRRRGGETGLALPGSLRARAALSQTKERWESPGRKITPTHTEWLENPRRYLEALPEVDGRWTPTAVEGEWAFLLREGGKAAALFSRWRPDRVVVWNGQSGVSAVAAGVAKQMGIPVLHLENGWFPGSLQWGYQGVNAFSWWREAPLPPGPPPPLGDFSRTDGEVSRLSPLGARLPAMDRLLKMKEEGPLTLRRFQDALRSQARQRRSSGRTDPPGDPPPADPSHPLVLLALQVPADTQMLLHSPWIRRPVDAIAPTSLALAQAFPQALLAVRPHPLDPDSSTIVQETARVGACLAEGNLSSWLGTAKVVVVVNSTVGVEALQQGVGVVTLGRAVYGRPGVAEEALTVEALPGALTRAWDGAGPEASRFLGVLGQYASLPGERLWVTEETFHTVWNVLKRESDRPLGEPPPSREKGK